MYFCGGLDSEGELLLVKFLANCQVSPGRDWWVQGDAEGNAGGERVPFAHTPSVPNNTASVPQPVCKKHSMRSITQEFCPYPVVPGHWRPFTSCILSPHPSDPQWLLQQHVLGSHERTVYFPCSGNTPHWEQWGVCDKSSWHTSAQTSLLRLGTNCYRDRSSQAASLHSGEMLSNGSHPGLHRSRGDGFSFLRLWWW